MMFLEKSIDRRVQEKLDFLMESRDWDAQRLLELQHRKLESLLQHAYSTCPFYHDRFEKVGFQPKRDFKHLEDLLKIPLLTKKDIQKNLSSLKTTSVEPQAIRSNSTGGSTGAPLTFLQDDNYRLWADAMRIRSWRRFPEVSHRAVEAVLWGADRDVGKGIRVWDTMKMVLRYRTLQLNTFDLDDTLLKKYFRIFNLVRPKILRGYATSLSLAAEYVEKQQLTIRKPRVVISTAEMLRPEMRERIERVFGAEVIDSYGCREVSQIATECGVHDGLHIAMENQKVELVDHDIVVTNLNNFGMPFIRYQVGDRAESLLHEKCRCGRDCFRISKLMGRDNENIKFPNGKTVNAIYFQYLFFEIGHVEQFQVIYSQNQQELRIRMVSNEAESTLVKTIRERIKVDFDFPNVSVEYVDKIPLTRTGKFRFVYTVDDFENEP